MGHLAVFLVSFQEMPNMCTLSLGKGVNLFFLYTRYVFFSRYVVTIYKNGRFRKFVFFYLTPQVTVQGKIYEACSLDGLISNCALIL